MPCRLFVLLVMVGNVTANKLEELVKVPDRVQLRVYVTGQGAVCVIVRLKGTVVVVAFGSVHPLEPFGTAIVKYPKVLVPLELIVVDA